MAIQTACGERRTRKNTDGASCDQGYFSSNQDNDSVDRDSSSACEDSSMGSRTSPPRWGREGAASVVGSSAVAACSERRGATTSGDLTLDDGSREAAGANDSVVDVGKSAKAKGEGNEAKDNADESVGRKTWAAAGVSDNNSNNNCLMAGNGRTNTTLQKSDNASQKEQNSVARTNADHAFILSPQK